MLASKYIHINVTNKNTWTILYVYNYMKIIYKLEASSKDRKYRSTLSHFHSTDIF